MKKEDQSFDFLKILTKDQILLFLKQNYYFNGPTEKDVKFFKWNILSNANQKKMDEHCESQKSDTSAEEADKIATEFNNETDHEKRVKLLEKRAALVAKIEKKHGEFNKLMKERDTIDKLIE